METSLAHFIHFERLQLLSLEKGHVVSPSQELQEFLADLPECQGGLGVQEGPGAQGILVTPCFLGALQDLWPP